MGTVLRWNDVLAARTVGAVPPSREDKLFAERIAVVLRELRKVSGWTQEEAAEAIGVPTAKVGRWERAQHPPKGYDLGRAYRAYEPFGADWHWFFDPPEAPVSPVRDRLAELARAASALALEDLEVEQVEPRATEARRGAARDKRPA